ncbi:hypothetical protein [Nostoc sp.]|uniref:hypothetical protein n=1 Tax=Nostoc sp. TaxID=1180 RepID=UPI002FFD0CF4
MIQKCVEALLLVVRHRLDEIMNMMLNALEFQAKIQNGLIQIPDEYKQELREGDDIKVIVLVNKKSFPKKDIIDELTDNPVQVNGVLAREEIYSH